MTTSLLTGDAEPFAVGARVFFHRFVLIDVGSTESVIHHELVKMNAVLLGRAHGTIGPQSLQRYKTARLLHGIQPAPSVGFDGTRISVGEEGQCHSHKRKAQDVEVFSKPAHPTGVNALAIDNQYGRL